MTEVEALGARDGQKQYYGLMAQLGFMAAAKRMQFARPTRIRNTMEHLKATLTQRKYRRLHGRVFMPYSSHLRFATSSMIRNSRPTPLQHYGHQFASPMTQQ